MSSYSSEIFEGESHCASDILLEFGYVITVPGIMTILHQFDYVNKGGSDVLVCRCSSDRDGGLFVLLRCFEGVPSLLIVPSRSENAN